MVFRTISKCVYRYRVFLGLLIILPETGKANGGSSKDVPEFHSKLDASEHMHPYKAHFSEDSKRAHVQTPPTFQFPNVDRHHDLFFPDTSPQEVKTDRNQEAFIRTRPDTEGRKSSFRCPHDLYTCQNKDCVAHSARCDDHPDCSDQSDEAGCPEQPKNKPTTRASRPGTGANNNGKQPKYKPTGRPGSPTMDNADPGWAERKKKLPCGAGLWSCVDKSLCILPLQRQCIVPSFRCDGKKHCHDGSDEWNCGQETIRQLMDERDKRKAARAEDAKEAFAKQERFAKMIEKERQRMQEEEGFTVPDVRVEGSEGGDKEEL